MVMIAQKMSVAILGASGYVGTHLINHLLEHTPWTLKAISRSAVKKQHPRLEVITCDLYHHQQLIEILRDVEVVVYLVHSMLPSARLDQGYFQDFDLVLADNLRRAVQINKVKHVIYLGALIPKIKQLSTHLESRLEVEQCLSNGDHSFISLRAGIIIGPNGSSFTLMYLLVKRLMFMICPSWTQTLTTPVDLEDMIELITEKIAQRKSEIGDVGGETTLTYLQMMKELAGQLGLSRFFIKVPLFTPQLSRLWVSLVTGAPRNLVSPLVKSLRYPMVVDPSQRLMLQKRKFKTFEQSLRDTLTHVSNEVSAFQKRKFRQNEVRSIQRMLLSKVVPIQEIAAEYLAWLPRFLFPFIKVKIQDSQVCFCLLSQKIILLQLQRDKEQSNEISQVFQIEKGLLVARDNKGWLEFRKISDGKTIIAAIHRFIPALPWFIYRVTQAMIHWWVMKSFEKHLQRKRWQ